PISLYKGFHRIWANAQPSAIESHGQSSIHEIAVNARLGQVTPLHRAILLLTMLEEFSTEEAAEIVGVTPQEAITMMTQAISEIERETSTDVLIIEDEP